MGAKMSVVLGRIIFLHCAGSIATAAACDCSLRADLIVPATQTIASTAMRLRENMYWYFKIASSGANR
jgi:hypothetical protein